ncbi:unnamed protein product [Periconia digitata]|uniref:Aminoglycoside phosphotransferase domain-containing protein n=1 Tax=Periconia digitata TaxID=1303443 RepID=A0A9W4XT31_9PLEO|nr:unnamed protein product [Periconia digitata]
MKFLQNNATTVPTPKLYAYEPPGSQQAVDVGACYMLIEGFYGNTLQDVKFDICDLPTNTQERIISQWASVQAELATFSFPQIGSISNFSKEDDGVVTIGPLAAAAAERFAFGGPFATCTFVFCDIVASTELFKDKETSFHLNHMDMGTQNILVDDEFNFLAVIDWEFAQSAPVQVNHFPMPFPLISSEASIQKILQDTEHLAFRNVSRQTAAQQLYWQKFQDAERNLAEQGRPVIPSISERLRGPASRIYAILEKLGGFWGPKDLTYEMVRLSFGIEGDAAKEYLERMERKMNEKES